MQKCFVVYILFVNLIWLNFELVNFELVMFLVVCMLIQKFVGLIDKNCEFLVKCGFFIKCIKICGVWQIFVVRCVQVLVLLCGIGIFDRVFV